MKYITLEGFGPKIPIFDEEILCNQCSYPKDERGCHSCAIFISKSTITGGIFYFDRIFSVGEYYKSLKGENNLKDNLRLLILSFKSQEKYAPYCAELLKIKFEEVFSELGAVKDDFVICCIPDLNTEVYQKGSALALEFSKKIGIPFYPILKKIRETKKQHKLHLVIEKYENVRGAYEVDENFVKFLENKKVIIVDDVTTSLATANECSKILSWKGVETIFVFSIGRFILNKEENASEDN